MFMATVQLDTDVLDAVRDDALTAPARMRREMGIVARGRTAQLIVTELSTEPGPPNHPINWTSEKQRRFVMAKLKGRAYVRSHRQSRGWTSVLNTLSGDDGGVILIVNTSPYSQFVQGESQQGFLSKWPLARLVIRNHQEELQDEVIDAWYKVTNAV